jgi:hypothetical protein
MLHLRAKAIKTIARPRKTHAAGRVCSAALTQPWSHPMNVARYLPLAVRLLIGLHFRPKLA